MLYHVYVQLHSPQNDSETKLGLTEAQLRERVLTPYGKGRAFVLNGRTIESGNIHSLKVSRGLTPVDQLLARATAEDRASPLLIIGGHDPVPYLAFSYCEDVTDEFILGPPGFAVSRRRRASNPMGEAAKRPPKKQAKKPKRKTVAPRRGSPRSKRDDNHRPLSLDPSNMTAKMGRTTYQFPPRSQLLFCLLERIHRSMGTMISFETLRAKDEVWDGKNVTDEAIRGAVSRLKNHLVGGNLRFVARGIKCNTFKGRPHVRLELHESSNKSA